MSSLVVLRREKYLRIISYRTTSMAHIGQRNSNFINKLVGSTRVSDKFNVKSPEKKTDKLPKKKTDKLHETDKPPEKKVQELLTNVRIYILCHTQERLESALEIYKEYKWAVPVKMKYQDCTFENAFWKQLGEMKDDWLGLEMIGTLSYKANRKTNIKQIDRIINDRNSWSSGYFNFLDIGSEFISCHPHLLEISTDVCTTLGRRLPSVAYCNYWMCTPHKMVKFIEWFETKLKPAVVSHPLSMTDAQYIQGKLSQSELLQLCGVPYYPHVPFVMERLNKMFFVPDIDPDVVV